MRSAPSSPGCLRNAPRTAATVRVLRARGRRGSISASPSSNASSSGSPNASDAAASRSTDAGLPIPATGQRALARVRAIGSATAPSSNRNPGADGPSGRAQRHRRGARVLQRNPVAAQRAATGRVINHILQLTAVRLDDAGGRHIVLETSDQHAAQSKATALLEGQRQNQLAIALPPPRGADPVAGGAALLEEVVIELVADMRLADELVAFDQPEHRERHLRHDLAGRQPDTPGLVGDGIDIGSEIRLDLADAPFEDAVLRAPSKALAQRGDIGARMAQRRRDQLRPLVHYSFPGERAQVTGCSSR